MIYIIGKITYIAQNYIYLENNYIGRKIFIKQNEKVVINKIAKIYTTEMVVDSNKGQSYKQLYGFITFSDFILFNKLITLPSIGPKTAMNILDHEINLIMSYINNHDIQGLCSLKGINEKIAKIIINNIPLLLYDKNSSENNKNIKDEQNKYIEIIDSLKALGYTKKEIEYGINKLKLDDDSEFIVEDVLSEIIKNISDHKIS